MLLSLSNVVPWGQVWYLIVSIPDLCFLSYFELPYDFSHFGVQIYESVIFLLQFRLHDINKRIDTLKQLVLLYIAFIVFGTECNAKCNNA